MEVPREQEPARPVDLVPELRRNVVSSFYGVDLFASAADFAGKRCIHDAGFGVGQRLGEDGLWLKTLRCEVRKKPDLVYVYFLEDERAPDLRGRLVGVTASLTSLLGGSRALMEGYLEGFQKEYGPLISLGGSYGMASMAMVCRPGTGDCLSEEGAIQVRDTVFGAQASFLSKGLVIEAVKRAIVFERSAGEKSFGPGAQPR